jgi:hypothetical protein
MPCGGNPRKALASLCLSGSKKGLLSPYGKPKHLAIIGNRLPQVLTKSKVDGKSATIPLIKVRAFPDFNIF